MFQDRCCSSDSNLSVPRSILLPIFQRSPEPVDSGQLRVNLYHFNSYIARLDLVLAGYNPRMTARQFDAAERLIHEGAKFNLVRRRIETTSNGTVEIDLVRHPGAVVILPLISDDEIVMIRNYRYTVGTELWELPAGTLDVDGEPTIDAARRELEEETGYRASRIEPLCVMYPSPGFIDERIEAFVARDLTTTKQQLEPTERIRVERVSTNDAIDMCRKGIITDAKTQVALFQWRLKTGAM